MSLAWFLAGLVVGLPVGLFGTLLLVVRFIMHAAEEGEHVGEDDRDAVEGVVRADRPKA